MNNRYILSLRSRLKVRSRIRFLLDPPVKLESLLEETPNLYLGNLTVDLPQYETGNFVGLALERISKKDLICDLRKNLPFRSNSVKKIQAEDVLEHLDVTTTITLLDEIWRILTPNEGVFRISVPDYRSPVLKRRSVYDHNGAIIADLYTSTVVTYSLNDDAIQVTRSLDGNSHQWYPTLEIVKELINKTKFGTSGIVDFYHGFQSDGNFFAHDFPTNDMPVSRMPPNDLRANGAPISIIADLRKI